MGMLKKEPSKLSQTLIDDIVQQETPKKGKKRHRQELEEAGEDSSLADSRRAEKKQRKEKAEQDAGTDTTVVDSQKAEKKKQRKQKTEQQLEDTGSDSGTSPTDAGKAEKKQRNEKGVQESADACETTVAELDPAEYRKKMLISSECNELPDPVQTFDSAPFGKKMRSALKEAGFTAPTAIQAQGWPLAVRGDDLISVAKTGSGKTLAFLLPAFRMINKGKLDASNGPVALVLAPTRELATQIEEVAVKFGSCLDVRTATVYGGVPKPPQVKALRSKPQLVVATPGRLMDLMNDKAVSLGSVSLLALDEADRMLDMGFEPQMEQIMKQIPAERQTLLFSATWPKAVRKLASKYLRKDSVHLNVGETEELAANKAVTQEFFKLDDDEKENKLWRILYDMGENTKILIFGNTKNRINKLQKAVWDNGYDCIAMHGDKTQWERDAALAKFVSGEVPVMLATDVCARGLDIKDVTHVLNFDMARDVESYIHRIGRTGRAGASGVSITFFNPAYDMECAPALAKIATEAGQVIPAFLEQAAAKTKATKNKLWKY
jgi:superfamily II DNA/RNA helicase